MTNEERKFSDGNPNWFSFSDRFKSVHSFLVSMVLTILVSPHLTVPFFAAERGDDEVNGDGGQDVTQRITVSRTD